MTFLKRQFVLVAGSILLAHCSASAPSAVSGVGGPMPSLASGGSTQGVIDGSASNFQTIAALECRDGEMPDSQLTAVQERLYGTAAMGGGHANGSIFEVQSGKPLRVIYSFTGGGDGARPDAPLLWLDRNLYGTTSSGGATQNGVVFRLTPDGQEQVLHSFGGSPDGATPSAGLTYFGGKLYGTTTYGGAFGFGTVFSITTTGTVTILHSFGGPPNDGALPYAGLTAIHGSLYGVTGLGGANRGGTVFEFTPSSGERVLYSFGARPDGQIPQSTMVALNGKLYGTTVGGGKANAGTAFEISASGNERVIFSFSGTRGVIPNGLVRFGNQLAGTTNTVAGWRNAGVAFTLTTSGQEAVVYQFKNNASPTTPTFVRGVLYGATGGGGPHGCGTVFSLSI